MRYLEKDGLEGDGVDTSQWTKDRQDAILWARDILARSFLLLDTETTGLNTNTSEIVQIAVICSHGATILDTLVKPRNAIPKEAIAIHHSDPVVLERGHVLIAKEKDGGGAN